MDTLVTYLVRSVLISGLLLGYYVLALRNRKLHSFNRVWLLTALFAAVVLPLIRLDWLTWHSASRQPLEVLITGAGAHPASAGAFPVWTLTLVAGSVISASLLAILGVRVARVYRLKRRNRRQWLERCCLIEVDDRRAPFSFLRNLFWREGMDIHDPVQRKIFDHELAHIRGGHTYDNLFAQTLAAVFWMNPFFWLIRRELQMVHEFIADDESVATGDTEAFARMLLQAYAGGSYLDPSPHFFHSPIKRRLRMISSSKPPSGLRKALALPVLLAVMALACSKEQGAPARITKPLSVTLVKQLKLSKDSLDRVQYVRINGKFNVSANSGKLVRITFDTLGTKAQLDGIQVQGLNGTVPPPPPPRKG